MYWTRVETNWDQIKRAAQEHWSALTDEDLTLARNSRKDFIGRVTERYGVPRADAERQVLAFMARYE